MLRQNSTFTGADNPENKTAEPGNFDPNLFFLSPLQNIGELTSTDVDKVIQYGRDVRGLAKRFEEHDRAVAIPAKVRTL